MKLSGSTLAVLVMCAAVAACMPPLPVAESKENLLASSGFRTISVNTPAKVAAFKQLPAHELSRKNYKGKAVWVYPDREVCGCVYIGSQKTYDAYIKKATQRMISDSLKVNDSDDPYNPTAEVNALDYDWANDPEAYGINNDW
jgi:hypothetical protein